jgi:hypothetical protein
MARQLVVAGWLTFGVFVGVGLMVAVLILAIPRLTQVFDVAGALVRRADLIRRAEAARPSSADLETILELTGQLAAAAGGRGAVFEQELETVRLARLASARGDWEQMRACLAQLRRA